MSLSNPQSIRRTKLAVLGVGDAVQNLLASTLMIPQPDQGTAGASDAPLPVDRLVRLMEDIPELSLRRGDLGVVISVWWVPIVVYEVEFGLPDENCRTRVLVLSRHLRAVPIVGVHVK